MSETIREYYERRVIELNNLGVAVPNDLERIGTLLMELDATNDWMGKAAHRKHCMKLDPYDERDFGCTCGKDALLNVG